MRNCWCLRTLDGIAVVAAGTKIGKRTDTMVEVSIIIVEKSRTGMAKGTRTGAGAGMENGTETGGTETEIRITRTIRIIRIIRIAIGTGIGQETVKGTEIKM